MPYYLIGTGTDIDIHIQIRNTGEGAYEASVRVQLPPGVTYVKAYDIQSVSLGFETLHINLHSIIGYIQFICGFSDLSETSFRGKRRIK